jgi:membrane protein implicated in regulation of membrane protease activity
VTEHPYRGWLLAAGTIAMVLAGFVVLLFAFLTGLHRAALGIPHESVLHLVPRLMTHWIVLGCLFLAVLAVGYAIARVMRSTDPDDQRDRSRINNSGMKPPLSGGRT